MRTLVILADSVCRHMLEWYRPEGAAITPNLSRLAREGTVFDNHWCGSAPCMPARRDAMTGRINFLERPWGGIEPFDHTLPRILRNHGVYTRMVTDHYHYFEAGGENYHADFTTWEFIRGQEYDGYLQAPGPPGGEMHCGKELRAYEANRTSFTDSDRFPSSVTYTSAARWIDEHHDSENWMLWVEGYDPHEPFDVPRRYLEMYEDRFAGKELYWPKYVKSDFYTPEGLYHLRNRFRALLTMTDEYIGRIFDVLDARDLWHDTMVIFTTDHGFMLGEHGYVGKNYMPDYNEIFHIPLVIRHPESNGSRVEALTQNIDLFPTILEAHGADSRAGRNPIHGKSLLPLIDTDIPGFRDGVLYGIFGKTVNVTDGRYTYMKAPIREDNSPLYAYCGMPSMLWQYLGPDSFSETDAASVELGRLKWTPYPVYRIPHRIVHWVNYTLDFSSRNPLVQEDLLFDITNDYRQQKPVTDAFLHTEYDRLLCGLMEAHDAPDEQYLRLGLRQVCIDRTAR